MASDMTLWSGGHFAKLCPRSCPLSGATALELLENVRVLQMNIKLKIISMGDGNGFRGAPPDEPMSRPRSASERARACQVARRGHSL